MSDSIGGVVTMGWILIFITVVSGYLAFNVNYTKAFRMKNKIIDCFNTAGDSCMDSAHTAELKKYASEIGYNPRNNFACPTGYNKEGNLYCYNEYERVSSSTSSSDDIISNGNYHYYRIITQIDINIPVVQNVFSLRFLQVTGDTKTFKKG